jgi:hypothetical protein
MSDEVTNLINHAKEQARRDDVVNFFSKNSKIISRLIILILSLLLVFVVYNSIKQSRQAQYSEYFHQALFYEQIGDEASAKKELKKIYDAKSAPSGVRSLASLRLAAIYFNEGNRSEANKIYTEVNQCRFCDVYIKDLAGFLLVKNWMSDESEVNREDLLKRVAAIENSSKVFKYHIAEQRSFFEAKRGDYKKSYQILELIEKSSEAPNYLKERVKNEMQILVSKGYDPETGTVVGVLVESSKEVVDLKAEEKPQAKN